VRNVVISSYIPNNFPPFSFIKVSFSRKWLHLGARKAHYPKLLVSCVKIEDLPHPIDIPTVSHTITGSIHAVPSICISECDMKKDVRLTNPHRTADGGTLRAFPICLHP